jgi:transcriptional regulator with XRE-family HTH domain
MRGVGNPRRGPVGQRLDLGDAVREIRAHRNVTQETLGRLASLHRNYVGAIELGEISPTVQTLVRLTAGLGVSPVELVELYGRKRRPRAAASTQRETVE